MVDSDGDAVGVNKRSLFVWVLEGIILLLERWINQSLNQYLLKNSDSPDGGVLLLILVMVGHGARGREGYGGEGVSEEEEAVKKAGKVGVVMTRGEATAE